MEGGLKVHLDGDYGTQCDSNGLDNKEKVDYDNGMTAFFDGTPDDDNDDGEKLINHQGNSPNSPPPPRRSGRL